jgi:putative PIN family toxin of toxin-antitoxin system
VQAVLDTSILVRGLAAGPETAVGFIMDNWSLHRFQVVVSQHILDELEHVLAQPYFRARISRELVTQYVDRVTRDSIQVPITAEVHGIAPSPADDQVIATAISGGASYIVTGDHRLQKVGSYEGVAIVDPGTFAGVLRSELQERPPDGADK